MVDFRMKRLVYLLNHYTDLYNYGTPKITDELWDKMYFRLVQLENELEYSLPNSPTKKIHYATVNGKLNKVKHDHPMLSLAKTKDISEVKNLYNDSYRGGIIGMLKLDGLTCSLTYENGILVKAETRGNGYEGEDVLHNARVIPSIPQIIKQKETLVVDGEIICLKSNFEPFREEYKNPRNFAAGSIRLLSAKESASRLLDFVAWDVIKGINKPTLHEKLTDLKELGFSVVPWALLLPSDLEESVDYFLDRADRAQIPIDGLVYKLDNCREYYSQGVTSHHFKGGIAYKFYDVEVETNLLNIEYTLGRTSVLTPVAVFEPIDMDGAIVERASLHNLSVMEELLGKPYVGQSLQIYKANMIIPQVKTATIIKEGEAEVDFIDPPVHCPVCGGYTTVKISETGVKNLLCGNYACPGKLMNHLEHMCGKKGFDIKGISKATLTKLIDWGYVKNTQDIFTLKDYASDWAAKEGFGKKSVNKILDAIDNARNPELWRVISSMGIPLIGSTVSKQLAEEFKTYDNFRKKVNDEFYSFTQLEGIGDKMNQALKNHNYCEMDRIVHENIVIKEQGEIYHGLDEAILKDLVFVITGRLTKKYDWKNRNQLKTYIESLGGVVRETISDKTAYLINNDITSNSSKNKLAKMKNVPIINEDQFVALVEDQM